MRKLAHIEKIEWKRPIEGADRIELVGVLGWQCIAKKDEFNVGDLCVYIEIDSVVDKDNPDFAFLESKHYRIKTQKMRGVLSQGIVFPMSILHTTQTYAIGDDVTAVLKITEVEDDLPKQQPKQQNKHNKVFRWFMRFGWFREVASALSLIATKQTKEFPNWIIKTDEIRIQNMPDVLNTYAGKPMVVTEKIDGTSTSFGLRKLSKRKCDFAICSRNVRQADIGKHTTQPGNVYHEIAMKYNVKATLKSLMEYTGASTIVLQGETIGEGIQKNKYGLKGHDFYAFNLFVDGKKMDSTEAKELVAAYGIKWVPILDDQFVALPTVEEMVTFADGKSQLCDTLREGVVIRDHDNTVSFKCISNKFLLKHNL